VGFFSSILTYRERLGLSWGLVWPIFMIEILWAVVTHLMLERHDPGIEFLPEIPSLFLISPYLIRRMMSAKHPGFRLTTLRYGEPAVMNYTESFKAMWLLMWRTEVVALLLVLLISMFARYLNVQLSTLVPSAKDAPFFNAVGTALVLNGAGLFLMPLVMPGMFHKRYQGFRITATRVEAALPAPKPKSKPRK
jgi:hypothetical protein